jgi:hypothetical protein
MTRWILSGIVGLALTALGVYWWLQPSTFFNRFCVQEPCAISVIAAAITTAIGIFLLVFSIVSRRHAKNPQTMTIAIDEQAERDAAAVTQLQESVEQGENAESKVAAIDPAITAHDVASNEAFADLPGDEPVKRKAVRKPAKKKAAKKKK